MDVLVVQLVVLVAAVLLVVITKPWPSGSGCPRSGPRDSQNELQAWRSYNAR